ncbi:CBS domain-containing protein [Humitalea sp. 24SJ18S-53]|uniref:CBS domain-containing protein n=1 Tax=Humitalea sp. 24SJ18S-53 TaxID=3422307 RepID=UPI003D67341C
MKAKHLMTTDVVTVPPDTPVRALARLLADRHVSAVPVLAADGRVAGIVSESDLLRRLAGMAERPRGWFGGLFASTHADAARFARTHGAKARDIMTTDLVAVTEETLAADIALMMEERHVKRVLVLRDGMLVGVVSRADLLAALFGPADTTEAGIEDTQIRKAVETAIRRESWARPFYIWPTVEKGAVTFHGFCDVAEVRTALRVLAEEVPGVTDVKVEVSTMPRAIYGAE